MSGFLATNNIRIIDSKKRNLSLADRPLGQGIHSLSLIVY
jgi:hypothetical protein